MSRPDPWDEHTAPWETPPEPYSGPNSDGGRVRPAPQPDPDPNSAE